MTDAGDPTDDRPLPEKADRLRAFMTTGGKVVGGIAGAAVGLVGGPFVAAGASAALSDVFERVGLELYERLLAPRQGARAAGALDVALVRIEERLREGEEPRDDGFFDADADGRVDAEEALEGTLLTAANSYEERKVPLLGRLFANVAFDASIRPAHANFLLRLADRLTYRQLVILAFFARTQTGGDYEAALLEWSPGEHGLPSPALSAEMRDLGDMRLLGGRQDDGSVTATWDTVRGGAWKPSTLVLVALMPVAETLHRLMELDRIPSEELDAVLAELRGD